MFKVAVLTLSDKGSKGKRKDESGTMIAKIIKKIGGIVVNYDILPDEKLLIKKKLLSLCNSVDLKENGTDWYHQTPLPLR